MVLIGRHCRYALLHGCPFFTLNTITISMFLLLEHMKLCTTRFVLNNSKNEFLWSSSWETLWACIFTWVPILHSPHTPHTSILFMIQFYSNGFEWIINESIVVEVLSFIIIGLQWLVHDVCMASTNVFLCRMEHHHSGQPRSMDIQKFVEY